MRKTQVYTESILVFISKEQKKKLEKYASDNLTTLSDILRNAINEYLQNHQVKGKKTK